MGVCALAFRLVAAAAPLFYWAAVRPAYQGRQLPERFGAALALWTATASLLLFAFSLPEPWLQMAALTGQSVGDVVRRPELVARLIADTRFGRIWLLHQTAALILTSIGTLLALRGGRRPFLWAFASAISVGLLTFTALRGQAGTYGFLAGFSHAVHWIAAALWLGGLAHVLWTYRWVRRHGSAEPDAGSHQSGIGRSIASAFAPVALISVIVTVATGGVNGWLYVPSFSHLTRPGYGGWLLLKLVFVAGIFGLAVYNGWRAASPAGAETSGNGEAPPSLPPSLALEAIVGLGVIAASERLARQPPLVLAAFSHQGRSGHLAVSAAGFATAVGIVLFAAGIAFAVIGFRRWRETLQRAVTTHPRRAPAPVPLAFAGVGLGAVSACAGIALFVSSVLVPVTPWFDTANPLPAEPATIAEGQALYASHCALCHGDEGRGDGLLASSLRTSPGNLASRRVQALSDGDLMWTITEGVEGTEMMPFSFLSEEERWALVHYLRTLPKGSPVFPSRP